MSSSIEILENENRFWDLGTETMMEKIDRPDFKKLLNLCDNKDSKHGFSAEYA